MFTRGSKAVAAVRRVLLGAVLAGALVVVPVAVPAAQASPASFQVSHVHAAGAGAIATSLKGDFIWLNRSVRLVNVQQYIKANECADATIDAYHGSTFLNSYYVQLGCGGSSNTWYNLGEIVMSPATCECGILELRITVRDQTHEAQTTRSYFR
jgi:hypothetical protein